MKTENVNKDTLGRGPFERSRGNALAIALATAIPFSLFATPDSGEHGLAEDVEEKQYSMAEATESPKVGGSEESSVKSSQELETQEKQYSMHGEDPKFDGVDSGGTGTEKMRHGEHHNSDATFRSDNSLRSDELANVSDWNGLEVESGDLSPIGTVEDVVVDLDSGEITHVAVESDSETAKDRLLPVAALSRDRGTDRLMLSSANLSEKDGDEEYSSANDEVHLSQEARTDPPRERNRANLDANEHFCSDLVGMEVVARGGKEIGEIEQIVQIPNTFDAYVIVNALNNDSWGIEPEVDKVAVRAPTLFVQDDNVELSRMESSIDFESAPSIEESDNDRWYLNNGYDIIVISPKSEEYASR